MIITISDISAAEFRDLITGPVKLLPSVEHTSLKPGVPWQDLLGTAIGKGIAEEAKLGTEMPLSELWKDLGEKIKDQPPLIHPVDPSSSSLEPMHLEFLRLLEEAEFATKKGKPRKLWQLKGPSNACKDGTAWEGPAHALELLLLSNTMPVIGKGVLVCGKAKDFRRLFKEEPPVCLLMRLAQEEPERVKVRRTLRGQVWRIEFLEE